MKKKTKDITQTQEESYLLLLMIHAAWCHTTAGAGSEIPFYIHYMFNVAKVLALISISLDFTGLMWHTVSSTKSIYSNH